MIPLKSVSFSHIELPVSQRCDIVVGSSGFWVVLADGTKVVTFAQRYICSGLGNSIPPQTNSMQKVGLLSASITPFLIDLACPQWLFRGLAPVRDDGAQPQ